MCFITSGLTLKMHGRVGGSPIIGAGLFVGSEIGAATTNSQSIAERVRRLKQTSSDPIVDDTDEARPVPFLRFLIEINP